MAVPAIVGTPTIGGRIGAGTYTCALPTGSPAFYYAFVATSSMPNLVPPTGWTLLTSMNGTTLGDRWAIYTATPASSPGTTWERTGASATGPQSVLVVGVDQDVTPAVTTAASATSPAATATGECLVARMLTRLPSTNANPTYPTAATLGRQVSRQYQAAGNAAEVAVAHQDQSAAGAVATAAWTGSTSGNITAITMLLYPGSSLPGPSTVTGASTASLTDPTTRWVKGSMVPLWATSGGADSPWSAILPTSTGHRLYADLAAPSAGTVIDSRQAARIAAVNADGVTYVLRAHTSSSLFSSFDASMTAIVSGASLPLSASDLDAAPVTLHRSPNGYLWAAACSSSGNTQVTRSTDGGMAWSTPTTVVSFGGSDTGVVAFGQSGSTVVLVCNGNTGTGRAVRTIDQYASTITSGSWSTETLPSLPSGVTSDDHLAVTSAPDGRVLAVMKTTDATTSGHPVLYLAARSTGGTWTSTTIEPGPDVGGVRYTRPVVTIVGSDVVVMYGSIETPKDLTIRTAALSDLSTWSTRAAFIAGPDRSDSSVLPMAADIRRHGSSFPVLSQQRSDSTVTLAWIAAPDAVMDAAPSDGVGVTDAAGVAVIVGRTAADGVGVTDSAASSLTVGRAVDDGVGVADASFVALSAIRSVVDALGLTDSVAAAVIRAASLADAAGVMDVVDVVAAAARAPDDQVGASDAVLAALGRTSLPADAVGVADSVSIIRTSGQVAADVVGLTDVVSAALGGASSVADNVDLSDAASRTLAADRSSTDSTSVSDQVAVSMAVARTQPDPVAVTDSVSVSMAGAGEANPADGVGVTDAVSVVMSRVHTVADFLAVVDSASNGTGATGSASDGVGLADSVTAWLERQRGNGDGVGVTDAASSVLGWDRSPANSVGVGDTALAVLDRVRTVTVADTVGLVDTVTASTVLPDPPPDLFTLTAITPMLTLTPMEDLP